MFVNVQHHPTSSRKFPCGNKNSSVNLLLCKSEAAEYQKRCKEQHCHNPFHVGRPICFTNSSTPSCCRSHSLRQASLELNFRTPLSLAFLSRTLYCAIHNANTRPRNIGNRKI